MAYWFHRNPLKATAPVSFKLYGVVTSGEGGKLCNELRTSRARLLDLLTDMTCTVETMKNAAELYTSLLQGFISALDDDTKENKLRYIQKFKWTDTLLGNEDRTQQDALFELVSMAFNVALWYTKFASRLAGKEDISSDDAKEVHTCLKVAAGIFKSIKEEHASRLLGTPEKGTDLDPRVLEVYIVQSQAEAQEVTIARAIEMKHSANIISALAYATAGYYHKADKELSTLEPRYSTKWRKYLQLKNCFYMAYAYSFNGQNLLASDKCGEAIRSLQEAEKMHSQADAFCGEYRHTKGPGNNVKPSEHIFFRKLGTNVKITLEKCQRENGFIYFHKVPPDPPVLELKANYGLVQPIDFELPALHVLWTKKNYAAFDISLKPAAEGKDKEKDKKKEEDAKVKPMKEPDLKPQKDTGCSIS
uniref:BRO1 domain-containing protein BROX-like isoform X1 n=1 Tax=Myxine glutinosa TaxID=7769 RepID=UPI00358EC519